MRKEKRNDRIRWTIIQHTVLPLSQQNILSLIYFPENCFFSEICLFLQSASSASDVKNFIRPVEKLVILPLINMSLDYCAALNYSIMLFDVNKSGRYLKPLLNFKSLIEENYEKNFLSFMRQFYEWVC